MSSKKSKRAKFINAKIAEHSKIRGDHAKEEQMSGEALTHKALKTPKIDQIVTPEKQVYLDRCAKRTRTLAELESRRRIKKIGIIYDCKHTDVSPFAFMVERGSKKELSTSNAE